MESSWATISQLGPGWASPAPKLAAWLELLSGEGQHPLGQTARSRAARVHRFLCCQLMSWECFPPLWLLFSPDFFEQALLQCLLPSQKGSAPLSPLGTGAVPGFCVPGISSYSRNGEFCVLQKPGWALWDWGSSLPSAPLSAKEQHGLLPSFSSWEIVPSVCEQGRTSHPGPEQHPFGKVREQACVMWWGAVGEGAMLSKCLGAVARA